MNRHSTLVSYLHRLLVLLTGSLGKPGTHYVPTTLVDIASGASKQTSPVVGARIVGGLVPCNVIAEEILTDHPKRYRAMLVEAANPAHSLADSKRMREALARARHAGGHRRGDDRDRAARPLRAARVHAVREGRGDVLQLRVPARTSSTSARACSPPPPGPLPEAEIHARLVRGARRGHGGGPRAAARGRRRRGRVAYAQALHRARDERSAARRAGAGAPLPHAATCPRTLREGAVLLGLVAQARDAARGRRSRARASAARPSRRRCALFERDPLRADRASSSRWTSWSDVLGRIGTPDGKIHLALPDLLEELGACSPTRPIARRGLPVRALAPASGARSPRTPSSATRRGERRTPAARCA